MDFVCKIVLFFIHEVDFEPGREVNPILIFTI